jgi:hypothetical protein
MAVADPESVLTDIVPGQLETIGTSLSVTVTVKLQVSANPATSVATKVLVVVPTGKALPLDKPAI